MSAAKTAAERVQGLRERRAALGQTRLEIYAHPDDHEQIKALATKLQAKRARALAAKEGQKPKA